MTKILYNICLLQFLVMSCQQGAIIPMEDVFPQAKLIDAGIKVKNTLIADMSAYEIVEFSEEEKNRNHYTSRGTDTIQFLVMHYTVGNFESALDTFTANKDNNRVSSHYIITQKEEEKNINGGMLFQIVPDNQTAWHAGLSYWRGITNVNSRSIGIENVNKGFIGLETNYPTWFKFDELQIATLGKLSQHLVKDYNIAPYNVIGHADIAPIRKQDPGILFPWGELYRDYGVGAWLSENEQAEKDIQEKFIPKEQLPQQVSEPFFLSYLQSYGYAINEIRAITEENQPVIKAFKAHFSRNQHPEHYDANINKEDMKWIWGLAAKYKLK